MIIKVCPKEHNKDFSENLERLHYAGNCLPAGRYLRFIAMKEREEIGGFILRSTIPHVTERDKYFNIYKYRKGGRIPRGDSDYWRILNKIPNMARAYILEDFQGKGYGIKMINLIESEAVDIWEKKYDDNVIGIDCLDVVGPEQAKIFLNNGWHYVGTTKGFSRVNRKPFGGKIKDHDYPIIGKMERINPKWHIYVKNLNE